MAEQLILPDPPDHNRVLKQDFIGDVCHFGQAEECCAFLVGAPEGFICGKGTSAEPTLRARVAAGQMKAKGDWCSGHPYYKTEGYDHV